MVTAFSDILRRRAWGRRFTELRTGSMQQGQVGELTLLGAGGDRVEWERESGEGWSAWTRG